MKYDENCNSTGGTEKKGWGVGQPKPPKDEDDDIRGN